MRIPFLFESFLLSSNVTLAVPIYSFGQALRVPFNNSALIYPTLLFECDKAAPKKGSLNRLPFCYLIFFQEGAYPAFHESGFQSYR